MPPVDNRRTADVQVAHLEGRIDMVEQRLKDMDKKIDGVVSSISEVLQEVRKNSEQMHRMEIEAAERSGHIQTLEQRFEDYLMQPRGTTQTTTTTTSPLQVEDDLVRYRKRAVDVLVISICILGIFGIALYISNNMLNKQAAGIAGKILEHAP